jgi:hypothetical protein
VSPGTRSRRSLKIILDKPSIWVYHTFMVNTLIVFASNNSWMVDFRHTPEAAKIIDLFGTSAIPAPFTTEAPVEKVLAAVSKLNPQYAVVVGEAR